MCHEQKCHGICFTQRHTAVQLTVYRLSSIVYLLLNVVGGRLPFLITISLHACICPFVKSKKSFCNTTVHNDTVPLFSCLYYLLSYRPSSRSIFKNNIWDGSVSHLLSSPSQDSQKNVFQRQDVEATTSVVSSYPYLVGMWQLLNTVILFTFYRLQLAGCLLPACPCSVSRVPPVSV